MPGRSCIGLLAISFLMLAPVLPGQSSQPAPDFARVRPSAAASTATAPDAGLPVQFARQLSRQPEPPRMIGFPDMVRAAGIIFSGTVAAVTRPPAAGENPRISQTPRDATNPPSTHPAHYLEHQSVETVAITFHVDHAIRGATPGQDLTITKWIGLWSSGQSYRIGEHVLLFLYPPSKLGLTSCVGASIGRFGVDGAGRILLSAQHLTAFRADPVLGGKSHASFAEIAHAVRRSEQGPGEEARGEEGRKER